jgi:hypothetical protein
MNPNQQPPLHVIPDNPIKEGGGLNPIEHFARASRILQIEREGVARGVMVVPSNVCRIMMVRIDRVERANVEGRAIRRGVNVLRINRDCNRAFPKYNSNHQIDELRLSSK